MKKYIILLSACLFSIFSSHAADYSISLTHYFRAFDVSSGGSLDLGNSATTFDIPFDGLNWDCSQSELQSEIRMVIAEDHDINWMTVSTVYFYNPDAGYEIRRGYVRISISGTTLNRSVVFQSRTNTFSVAQGVPRIFSISADRTTFIPGQTTTITLNGSETRYNYELLYNNGYSTSVISTMAGTGGGLSFKVQSRGTYQIRIAGTQTMMTGTVVLRVHDLFWNSYTFEEEWEISLNKDGERRRLTFSGAGNVGEFADLFPEFNKGNIEGWNPSMQIFLEYYDEENSENHCLSVVCGPNLSSKGIDNNSHLSCSESGEELIFRQAGGGSIKRYEIRGNVNPGDMSKHTIRLAGSQYLVKYELCLDDNLVATLDGNGGELTFSDVSASGYYSINALYQGQNIRMSGEYYIGPQVTEYNYTKEDIYVNPDQKISSITYYDGLGRSVQTTQIAASPVQAQDIVSFVEYDLMGRGDAISYLPYADASQAGLFRTDPNGEQKSFYRNKYTYDNAHIDANYAFCCKQYDKSGLGLVLQESAPGQAYQFNQHPVKYEHRVGGPVGAVRKYGIDNDGVSLKYLGTYSANTLTSKTTIQDTWGDHKSTLIEYHEPNGNLIACEQYISDQDRRITYYVYDDLGRQRYIIPPSVDLTSDATPDQLGRTCFYTEYDEYGRICKKYIPGASYILSVYDKRGRLVLTQDGNQRNVGKWAFTKYDKFNRPVVVGVIAGGSYESHKAALDTQVVFEEGRDKGCAYGYSNHCYPIVANASDVLTATFYDDYDWMSSEYGFRTALALNTTPDYTNLQGQPTGKKVRVLEPGSSQWLTSVNYYDNKYQTIQTVADLYPQGKEIVSNSYDYTGNVVEARIRQELAAKVEEYRKWFSYDQWGRLLAIDQQITGDTNNNRVTIVNYTYDALGRISRKNLHNDHEACTYNYDIAGANTRAATSKFSYRLETLYPSFDTGSARYDRQPATFRWSRPGQSEKGYAFSYDDSGQLQTASYNEFVAAQSQWVPKSSYDERDFQYDRNGNIKHLLRHGEDGTPLHTLGYEYNGNQLSKLEYNGTSYTGYEYDLSGNLTRDPQKDIRFEYNELNLPSRIFGNGGEVRYIYSSDGAKLATESNGSFTYYRSVMVYGQSTGSAEEHLLYILHPEGVVAKESNGYVYQYFLQDYLSNVRSVVAARRIDGRVILQEEQSTDYYPFGLAYSYNDLHKNRYLFGGKELQDASVGSSGFLGLYDFGARYYDPVQGRWFNIDPALQLTNPYLFCGNNPMVYVDPNGEFIFSILASIFCPALLPLTMSVDMGMVQGGFRSVSMGGSFWDGAWKGALTGTVGGGLSIIGGAGMGFASNLVLGVAEGAATGALDAALWGNDISKGLQLGGIAGGVLTTLASENMQNLVSGEGFRTNSNVFDRMSSRGVGKQDVLDYFGFTGSYNPNVNSRGYDSGAGNYWGVTRKDGTINYGDLAFENYATLKGTYMKESYHADRILSGKGVTLVPEQYRGFGINMHLEELNGYQYAFKQQGLFKGHSIPLVSGSQRFTSELKIFEIPYKSFPPKYQWFYNIPRRW